MIGWREWVGLPELGVDRIKAKIDTGARSSALHAFELERYERDGEERVRFTVHPLQRRARPVIEVDAAVHDQRHVRSSSGQRQLRPVILTEIQLGQARWPIEVTLTNRELMGFRFLLGRQAVRRRFLIDPGRSYLQGKREAEGR